MANPESITAKVVESPKSGPTTLPPVDYVEKFNTKLKDYIETYAGKEGHNPYL